MNLQQAKRVVALLRAAYPGSQMPPESQAVYAKSLMDFTEQEGQRAVNVAVTLEPRLPSIARLRELVFEERLQLPSSAEAWELVMNRVHERVPTRKCVDCAGFGTAIGGEDACPVCHGVGEVRAEARATLDPVTRRALDYVGGEYAVRTADRPEIIRAQFARAYDQFKDAAMRQANLQSLGVLEPAAERLSLESFDS